MKKVLFSGSAPSGNLTIGNYLGALSQWKRFQDEYDSIFCIVDLHAITVPRDPAALRTKSLDFLALFIACGLDPEKSTIFIQSQNPDHAELTWVLDCFCACGDLMRMTQFKEKSSRGKYITAGLLNYPVLMAADILLYGTALVPIGEDQKQHLELCRDIAVRFNSQFGEVFRVPEGFVPSRGGRVRNLLDPSCKMDKSHEDERTYIALLDTDDSIRSKIMKAKTDSSGGFDIDDPDGGIANLVTIMARLRDTSPRQAADAYRGQGYARLKSDLADSLIDLIGGIRTEYNRIRGEKAELKRLLKTGKEKAAAKSGPMIRKVKELCGLFPCP